MNTNDKTQRDSPDQAPLPLGLMMALAQNMHAMEDYARLSEQGRKRLIEQAASIHSREEMQELVRSMRQFL